MLSVQALKQLGRFRLAVDIELPTPGVMALFGRSGCGKSTVVSIIAGLLRPDEGRLALDAVTLFDSKTRIDVPPERRRMGCVFQDARLFPHLSVAGNLRYAEQRAPDRFITLDEVSQLLGLGPLMTRRTHQLSGGERQRVAIGRALLTQPRLLLLDEPLAALDDARREEVLPYLETLRDQLAIPMVYVTHVYSEVLRLATHMVLMDGGTVIAQGSLGDMSLDPHLRGIIGPEEVGAIVQGTVKHHDSRTGLTTVGVGLGELRVQGVHPGNGSSLRVQLLARDVIVSTAAPRHLSVRNSLAGTVTYIRDDAGESDLVGIDIGGIEIMARITKAASHELALRPQLPVWALVKSVSLRGRSFTGPARPRSPAT